MDLINRQAAIDGKISIQRANGVEIYSDEAVPVEYLKALPSAQPEPSQVARDIATIIENEKDMRVIAAQPEPCEDTVSRQRLLSDLKELVAAWKKYPVMAEQIKGVEAAIGYAEVIPSAQPEPKWIPVSERLPKDGERVLCTHLGGINPNRQVIEHIYEGGQFVLGWEMDMNPSSPTFMQRYMGKVVAWMPLPSPYREDGGERRTDE